MAKAEKVPGSAEITYRPLDNGDPATVLWNGHKFEANLPKVVTNADMIAQARGNPHFSVDGKSFKRVEPNRDPVPPPGADAPGDDVDDDLMVEVEE